MIAVPWSVLPDALDAAGSLDGRIVIDTTNQFGAGPMPAEGQTAAVFNAARMPGAALYEVLQHPDVGVPGAGGAPRAACGSVAVRR